MPAHKLNAVSGVGRRVASLGEAGGHLDSYVTSSHQLAGAIIRARCQIDLVSEYRTRLIADVLSGKVDVRDIPVEPLEEREELEKIAGHAEAEEEEMGQRRGP
jgi:type I restriction enzyme S subunit